MDSIQLIMLRRRLGMSRSQFARKIGCSITALWNWENGNYRVPKYIALACSAYVMNLPPYGQKLDN